MTPQETLHEISTMVYRNTDNFEMRISKDCYKSLISALEKQIPKKPIPNNVKSILIRMGNYDWHKEITEYECPNCNENTSKIYNYCDKCGQALDWSEE
jgi:hypothetical protein